MTTTERGLPPGTLGGVRDSLLSALYARSVETRKKRGMLRDAKAAEITDALDHDFARFDGSAMLPVTVLRTLVIDEWVRGFLREHPAGTVVEAGAGLGSRFERLDNGRAHWAEFDDPDVLALRRRFFAAEPRRRMFAASVRDEDWPEKVGGFPGPYLVVAEGVLHDLPDDEVHTVVERVGRAFPGARIAFDSASDAVEGWEPDDLTVAEVRRPTELPKPALARLRHRTRRDLASARAVLHDTADDFRVTLCRAARYPDGGAAAWGASARLLSGSEGPRTAPELADDVTRAADLSYCELPAAEPVEDDTPVLLLHGWAGSTADWDDVAPALAAGRRVVAYDHRGHGGSTKFGAAEAYSLDLVTADLEAFADRATPGPVHLVAHSMGGIAALRYAVSHPERVRSLVLVSTAPRPAASPPVRLLFGFLNLLVRRRGMAPLEGFIRRRVRVPDGTPAEERARLARQGEALTGMDPVAFVTLNKALRTYPPLLDGLGAITCPVTVVNGALDTGLRAGAAQFASRIAGARVEVIPGAGHSPQTEAPDAWLAVVLEHLARASGGASPASAP